VSEFSALNQASRGILARPFFLPLPAVDSCSRLDEYSTPILVVLATDGILIMIPGDAKAT